MHRKFPSIRNVAKELLLINENVDGECDVRLQVYPDGEWIIRSGLSDYDQDHRGYWGCGTVPGVIHGVVKRFDSLALAKDLIGQAQDQKAQGE